MLPISLRPTNSSLLAGGRGGPRPAALAARAGVQTVLFDNNPGVGEQIYRGIAPSPVTRREILGEDYWEGTALADEARDSGALIVNGATVWSLDKNLLVSVSVTGKARMIQARRVIVATGAL